jgi:hypothetical protein
LWEAGSLLGQEYGLLVNARITLRHRRLGIEKHQDGAKLVSRLTHELGMLLRRRTSMCLHWLYVHEADENRGFVTQLALHLPVQATERARAWLFSRFLDRQCRSAEGADAVRLRICRSQENSQRILFHTRQLRLLIRGIDPGVDDWSEQGQRRPLRELLGVPRLNAWPFGDLIGVQRLAFW